MARRRERRRTGRRATFWVALAIPALLALYAGLMYVTLPRTAGEEVRLGRFLEMAEGGEIDAATLLTEDNRVLFTRDDQEHWVGLPESGDYLAVFLAEALEQDLLLDIDQQELKALIQPATYIVPALIIVAAFLLFYLLLRSGSSPFLKAAARRGAASRPVTFDDVAGIDDAIAELREVRDYLLDPTRFADIGAEPPRGILLAGPPGTGKTLLARAVAGEAGVEFFSMSGTDFVEMYVGVGAARVRDLFQQVRERAPAILFIDELDAVGRTRAGGATTGQDERDQTLNQLLVELDGFERETGVVLIGATNRPDVLDPALLRRGRFDRQIVVDRPDRAGRLEILRVHARDKRLGASVDLARLAAATPGFTGADLASVLNEAALLGARRGRRQIEPADLDDAVDRILSGSRGNARLLTADERYAVACHEAGHAVVAWSFPRGGPVTRISIMGGSGRLGLTQVVPEEERFVVDREELEQRLAVTLGGRAAEQLLLGQPTSSARDDLYQATALARRMVCELGMSDTLGPRSLGVRSGSAFLDEGRLEADYSGNVAARIDEEIDRLIRTALSQATEVLRESRDVLDDLVDLLVERETLREADLATFAASVPAATRR